MTELERQILAEAKQILPYTTALRRHFHRHPEVAKEEFETQKKIEEELDLLGIPHFRVATTGVIGTITGLAGVQPVPPEQNHGRVIALRADIDALPVFEMTGAEYASVNAGKMHACGHDAHTAGLLGAAKLMMAHREAFAGKVLLVFQPGEELGYGARLVVESGAIDEATRSFAIHMASDIPCGSVSVIAGPTNASTDWFHVHIDGKSAHVSTPEKGIDAAYIAGQILVGVQGLVTRRTNPTDPVLIGIGKVQAGSAYNVVAQSADLEGTLRTLTPDLRYRMQKELGEMVRGTAAMYGGSATIEWQDFCSPVINDIPSAREVQKVAKAMFGEEHVITERKPAMDGDDMADIILHVPGTYCHVGTANPTMPNTLVPRHNDHFDIDEESLVMVTALHAGYALAYLRGEV